MFNKLLLNFVSMVVRAPMRGAKIVQVKMEPEILVLPWGRFESKCLGSKNAEYLRPALRYVGF